MTRSRGEEGVKYDGSSKYDSMVDSLLSFRRYRLFIGKD